MDRLTVEEIATSIRKVLLTAHQDQAGDIPTVCFHNQTVPLPMPCRVALQSPALDVNISLPSWYSTGESDPVQKTSPVMLPDYPSCPIWPSAPPRGDIYCETSMLRHPLVSHITALPWADALPMWICMGEERLSDGVKVVAQRATKQGVPMRWESYKAVPHNWSMLFPHWWQSPRCMQRWADTCKVYAEGKAPNAGGEEVDIDGEVRALDVAELTTLTQDEVKKLMRASQTKVKPWTGKGANEKL